MGGPRHTRTIRHYQTGDRVVLGVRVPTCATAGRRSARAGSTHPVQVFHERQDPQCTGPTEEGSPERRPLSREEQQRFFDHCDERVANLEGSGRKGCLAAFRDAVLFFPQDDLRLGTASARGGDAGHHRLGSEPDHSRSSVRRGCCGARYGKASRGSPPRQRTVLTVTGWAAAAVQEWVDEIRPAYGVGTSRMLWPTERGGADKSGSNRCALRRVSRPAGHGPGADAATACATRTSLTNLKTEPTNVFV